MTIVFYSFWDGLISVGNVEEFHYFIYIVQVCMR